MKTPPPRPGRPTPPSSPKKATRAPRNADGSFKFSPSGGANASVGRFGVDEETPKNMRKPRRRVQGMREFTRPGRMR